MSESDHAQSLLAMAEKDLKAIRGMRETETFADEIFGFHAQQAVEKSFKAWIAALGAEYPLTPDLSLLLTRLEKHGCQVAEFWDLVEYNAYAVQFRYETFDLTEEPLDRPAAIVKVQTLWDYVKTMLGPAETAA